MPATGVFAPERIFVAVRAIAPVAGIPPMQALATYCHFAVIFRRSPVGLPVGGKPPTADQRLLQEAAWAAVTHDPLSGVKAAQP